MFLARELGVCGFKGLFDLCATREIERAERLVDGVRPGNDAFPDNRERIDIAVTAILQKVAETLNLVTSRLPEIMKVAKWIEGICNCLIGVAERQPDQVASGLELYSTIPGTQGSINRAKSIRRPYFKVCGSGRW